MKRISLSLYLLLSLGCELSPQESPRAPVAGADSAVAMRDTLRPALADSAPIIDRSVIVDSSPGADVVAEAADATVDGGDLAPRPLDRSLSDLHMPDAAAQDSAPRDLSAPDAAVEDAVGSPRRLRVRPERYARALRNPMKGITTNGVTPHEWATLNHVYFRWNELEDREDDGLERIRQVTAQRLAGIEARNVKVIPRVYLHWSGDERKYWPSDMTTDDYSSEQFQARLLRLVARLGEVWGEDPRIAFIELGIFGQWGEHHSPAPEPLMQALAGDAFAEAFPRKQISVRHPWREFLAQDFGVYWDSFSHYDQMWPHGQQVHRLNLDDERWKSAYIGGETAYDWGNWELQPGTTPTDSVRDPAHRAFIMNTIRWLHCTQLRWIHAYDASDPVARAGAEEIQRLMGYRYVIEEATFNTEIRDGALRVTMGVRNEGVAPFYSPWPMHLYLLDRQTREILWSAPFQSVDLRAWLGGEGWTPPDWVPVDHWSMNIVEDHWSANPPQWTTPPPLHRVEERFQVELPAGAYFLAVGVPDPANGRPNLRFANSWYFNGALHPLGIVGVGGVRGGALPEALVFDDPFLDHSISYASP